MNRPPAEVEPCEQFIAIIGTLLLLSSAVITIGEYWQTGRAFVWLVPSWHLAGGLLLLSTAVRPWSAFRFMLDRKTFRRIASAVFRNPLTYLALAVSGLLAIGVFAAMWKVNLLRAIWFAPEYFAVGLAGILASFGFAAIAARLHLDRRASSHAVPRTTICCSCGANAGLLFCTSCGTNRNPGDLWTSLAVLYSRRWIPFTGLLLAGGASVVFTSYKEQDAQGKQRQARFENFVEKLAAFRAPLVRLGSVCGSKIANADRAEKEPSDCETTFDRVSSAGVELSWRLPALRIDLLSQGICADPWRRQHTIPVISKACDLLQKDDSYLVNVSFSFRSMVNAYAALRRPPSDSAQLQAKAKVFGEAVEGAYWSMRFLGCLLSYAALTPRSDLELSSKIYPYCDDVISSPDHRYGPALSSVPEPLLEWSAWFAPGDTGSTTEKLPDGRSSGR